LSTFDFIVLATNVFHKMNVLTCHHSYGKWLLRRQNMGS